MSVVHRVLATLEGKGMPEQTERRTARIYQFPAKTSRTRQDGAGRKVVDATRPAECGSGWYHDAAIQEAEQARR
jgi:uncharacterized protein DUF2735